MKKDAGPFGSCRCTGPGILGFMTAETTSAGSVIDGGNAVMLSTDCHVTVRAFAADFPAPRRNRGAASPPGAGGPQGLPTTRPGPGTGSRPAGPSRREAGTIPAGRPGCVTPPGLHIRFWTFQEF